MTKTNSIQENSRHKLLSKKVDRIIDSSELAYGDVDGYEHFMVIERHMMTDKINHVLSEVLNDISTSDKLGCDVQRQDVIQDMTYYLDELLLRNESVATDDILYGIKQNRIGREHLIVEEKWTQLIHN